MSNRSHKMRFRAYCWLYRYLNPALSRCRNQWHAYRFARWLSFWFLPTHKRRLGREAWYFYLLMEVDSAK